MEPPAMGRLSSAAGRRSGGGETRYKGVRKRKWGKWVSEVRLPNSRERIWLGSYDTPEKAARAFDAAVFCLRGRKARFNFPHDLPRHIPAAAAGRSLSHTQIQAAAARFAHEGPSTSSTSAPPPAEGEGEDRRCGSTPAAAAAADSPVLSTTMSDGGATAESSDPDLDIDWSFVDLLASSPSMDSGASRPDFAAVFPMIDDFPGEFFPVSEPPQPPPGVVDFVEENVGPMFAQQSFLWDF